MGFFLLFGIGGSYALIYLSFRKSLATTGRKSSIYTADRLKVTTEAFGAIKELKLYNNSDIFLGRFEHPSLNTAKYTAKSLLISLIPKYLMETIAFASLIGSVLYMISIGYEQSFILASLTLYAFAGYRLIPGFQMLYQQITLIKFNYPALVFLLDDLETESKKQTLTPSEEIKFEDKILLEGISFTFPKTKKKILDRMNIEIQKNSSIGLVGSTGSGKTTFVDLLLGLIKQDEGKIIVDGVELNDSNMASWQKRIGYVPQEIFLYDDSIKKNIAFGIPDESVDSSKLEKAINNSQLDQFIESLPNGANTIVGERGVKLSGGQRQRIGIARALYNDPEILFMDEATSSLDGKTEDVIMESINHLSSQLTLFLVAHRVTTLRECDQIYFLENGKIIESGSYTYLLENSKSFKDLSNLGI
jgi:ABC-type bacteriocin/lantibiotic exporter with double-glycine peptidase domain